MLVQITNGDQISSEGRVMGLSFIIKCVKFIIEAYFLPLAGSNVVLGVIWLQTLETMQ